VVIKVKGKQIKTSPFVSPLKTSSNHQKMADTVKALLKSENRTAIKKNINTNSNIVVLEKQKPKLLKQTTAM
jgi:hypothetical protein